MDSKQYHRGYQNAIDDFQKKLKLRSRYVIINKGRSNENHPPNSQISNEKRKRKLCTKNCK